MSLTLLKETGVVHWHVQFYDFPVGKIKDTVSIYTIFIVLSLKYIAITLYCISLTIFWFDRFGTQWSGTLMVMFKTNF